MAQDDDSEQVDLDWNTVDDDLLRVMRLAEHRFGMSREEAYRFFESMPDGERRDWRQLLDGHRDLVELDPKAVEYPSHIDWLMTECGLSASEAQTYEYLDHALGPEVPCGVVEASAPPTEWDVDRIAGVHDTVDGETIYRVIAEDGGRVWVDGRYGDVYDEHEYVWCGDDGASPYNLDLDDDDTAPALVFHDNLKDYHADNVVIVSPDAEKYKARYYKNVIDGRTTHPIDPLENPDIWEIASAFVKGSYTVRIDGWRSASTGPTGALDFERVRGGWHSTHDRSEMQEFVNALTDGRVHEAYGLTFPVVVTFGKTSNVFSIIVNLYAPEDHVEELREIAEDKRSFGSL